MKMKMRSKKVYTIAAFLSSWTFIAYFFLIRNTNDLNSQNNNDQHMVSINENTLTPTLFKQKVKILEREVRRESQIQNKLIYKLVNGLKIKYPISTTTTTTTTTENNEVAPIPDTKKNGKDFPVVEGNNILVKNNEIDSNLFENNSIVKEIPLIDLIGDTLKVNKTHLDNGEPIIPVLVFACNRISVKNCLDNLVQYRTNKEQFPIIVSQDCAHKETRKAILSYKDEVHLIEQPDQSDIFVKPKDKKFKGYYKISRHYNWALNTTFGKGFDYVIIVEDDLNVSPDFFEYFHSTYKLLEKDKSLWCVSAWNDNGKLGLIDTKEPELLYRSDFFPGLGWMLGKDLWSELSPKWPPAFWDDWIRQPVQRKDRVCIRPEVSRTRTFGKIGVSNGLFFDKHLKYIKLNEEKVPFDTLDLSYLLKENYDNTFLKNVYTYPILTYEELRRNIISVEGPVRIKYSTREEYKKITRLLGLMDDFKSGVPRTAYHGIVSFFYNNRRVFLAPNVNWKGYDVSWS